MNDDEIRQFLVGYGRALSAGDSQAISNCWEVPGLVLSDEGALAISDAGEIERFFAQAADWYQAQGLMSTAPELQRVEMLSEKIAAVDVRWSALDAAGEEQSSELSHYLLLRGQDGRFRIRVALTRTT